MVSNVIACVKYKDLEECTNGFSKENFIGKFQFGKVYRGMFLDEEVIVKIWEGPTIYKVYPGDNDSRMSDEVALLKHETLKSHPNLVKLIGHCRKDEKPGIIYHLKSLDTVHNLLDKEQRRNIKFH
ncbi:hypothetical protein L1049_024132 [Liquidambar formosana]|uniref:Protein kinase domain-containing protein n=1 Tax=Liquidambar formosana TaxID=63359 RepID=A0AAP0X4J8_LIQFO